MFPELALCGYPPEDLLRSPAFQAAAAAALAGMVVGLGTVTADLHNSAVVLEGGQVRHVYHKVHLPNYGVFDEGRYFEPGREVLLCTVKDIPVAITI